MTSSSDIVSATTSPALALLIQPACLEHKYIRHANSSHIFERPERIRAVLLGFAAALARLEAEDAEIGPAVPKTEGDDDLSSMLSSLSIQGSTSAFLPPSHISLPTPPLPPMTPGQILMHHPALQLAHSEPIEAPFPYLPRGTSGTALPSSKYLRDLYKWASEAVEMIKTTGCEIPRDPDLGLNAGDLYLGPGSILAIEGAIQTVCQAVDGVCKAGVSTTPKEGALPDDGAVVFPKAFCAIRPPGHHCGEDVPSGFCYVNNVVVGAMHAYLEHDIDRAIIIDFDLHHGNGTQALVMPLNAAANLEDLAMAGGKPRSTMMGRNGPRRGWKGFYGSVHDIYSYPCEVSIEWGRVDVKDGDLDLIKDASVSLAGHGQYIENIHLQPYKDEADFYARIYPLYLALLDKALVYMRETEADPDRTILFISAGFDACEHEHQGMQRHDRRVPASFYSRYTKDIAVFADKYTGGKVVSVLEGGYGDRALTSAALGHAVGMLGREGRPEWWSIEELELLERAVKKRRKGKLCQLAPDLASKPHIARAHALLAHFEGAAPPQTPAPSTNATPQQPRRTLRERRPKVYDEDVSPAPARRIRKPASTTQTPSDTPSRKPVAPQRAPGVKEEEVERDVKPGFVYSGQVPETIPAAASDSLSADMANVSLAYPSPVSTAMSPESRQESGSPPSSSVSSAPAEPPRIILRIPRPTPTPPPETTGAAPESNAPTRLVEPQSGPIAHEAAPRPQPVPAASPSVSPIAKPAAPPPVPRPAGGSPNVARPAAAPPTSPSAIRLPQPPAQSFRPGVMEPALPTPHARVLHTVEWEQTIDAGQLPHYAPQLQSNQTSGAPVPSQHQYRPVYPILPQSQTQSQSQSQSQPQSRNEQPGSSQ